VERDIALRRVPLQCWHTGYISTFIDEYELLNKLRQLSASMKSVKRAFGVVVCAVIATWLCAWAPTFYDRVVVPSLISEPDRYDWLRWFVLDTVAQIRNAVGVLDNAYTEQIWLHDPNVTPWILWIVARLMQLECILFECVASVCFVVHTLMDVRLLVPLGLAAVEMELTSRESVLLPCQIVLLRAILPFAWSLYWTVRPGLFVYPLADLMFSEPRHVIVFLLGILSCRALVDSRITTTTKSDEETINGLLPLYEGGIMSKDDLRKLLLRNYGMTEADEQRKSEQELDNAVK
jgi:hypothetical protein